MKMALVTTFRIAFKMGEVMSGGEGTLIILFLFSR